MSLDLIDIFGDGDIFEEFQDVAVSHSGNKIDDSPFQRILLGERIDEAFWFLFYIIKYGQ